MSTFLQDFKLPAGFPGRPENWLSEAGTFTSTDKKTVLFEVLHHSEPWTSHRAMFLIHGFGDHSSRYVHFTHYLKDTVGAVGAYDQKGHGRSEGLRGHIDRFSELVDDARLALLRLDEKIRQKFGKSEIHLFAHSMGGHVGLRLLGTKQNLPLASAIISAPMLGVSAPVPWFKKIAAQALLRVWDDLQISTGLDARQISRDPAAVKAYTEDRLVHAKMTSKMWDALVTAMEETKQKITELPLPVFFIIPMADGLVSSPEAQRYYEKVRAPAKDLLKLPEYFHEAFNDKGKELVFEAVKKWIQKNSRD